MCRAFHTKIWKASMPSNPFRKLIMQCPTFTTSEALEAGLSTRELYNLRDSGSVVELSRGVYRCAVAEAIAHPGLLAVAKRVPRGIICMVSALAYWDLTDELPSEIHFAVPRGASYPTIAYPPSVMHVFSRATFRMGCLCESITKTEQIAIYSPERTVVDMMRRRNAIGRDLAFQALRRYLETSNARPGEIMNLARQLRVEKPVADALEILTG
jgi:predicted transcriptional regulator of viral defense system